MITPDPKKLRDAVGAMAPAGEASTWQLRPAVPCPHCGGEVTVRGIQGETQVLRAAMPWELIVDHQLPGLRDAVLNAHRSWMANLLFTCGARALVAEVMPRPGLVDPAEAAYRVAEVIAGSWPAILTGAEVSFTANVGFDTYTAGPTLMDALAAPGGVDQAAWVAACLHERPLEL